MIIKLSNLLKFELGPLRWEAIPKKLKPTIFTTEVP